MNSFEIINKIDTPRKSIRKLITIPDAYCSLLF